MNLHIPTINDPELLAEIAEYGKIQEYSPGQTLIEPGQTLRLVPIVLEGSVKVMRTDAEGHDLLLYYVDGGETCAVTLTCCTTSNVSDIKVVAEEKTKVIAVPVQKHEEWSNVYRQWKDFVAMTYQKRFQEMLKAIDDVAFRKMDERLLKYLIVKSRQLKSFEFSMTHQEIASELGTSREVVSRLLKQLEKRKLVELGRNKIYVRDDLDEMIEKIDR
jgi:CRP/FNR family transcriptional regulator, anaerobic regulatory protein